VNQAINLEICAVNSLNSWKSSSKCQELLVLQRVRNTRYHLISCSERGTEYSCSLKSWQSHRGHILKSICKHWCHKIHSSVEMGRISSDIMYSSSFCTAKVIGMTTKSSFLRGPSAEDTHASSELTSFFSDDIPLGCRWSVVTSRPSQFQVKKQQQQQQMDF